MDRNMKMRVGVANIVLNEHFGKPTHQAMSGIQRAALQELIHKSTVTPSIAAELAEGVASLKWIPQDLAMLLAQLQQVSAASGITLQRRRQLQDYTAILHYADELVWDKLNDADASPHVKMDVILELAGGLGLRLPTEGTLKLLCSFWMVVTLPAVQRVLRSDKQMHLFSVKRSWDKMRKNFAEPAAWVSKLPNSTAAFATEFPQLYQSWFKGTVPVVPPIEVIQLITSTDATYSCRAGSQPKAQASADTGPSGIAERMMSMMLDRIVGGSNGCNIRMVTPQSPAPRCLTSLTACDSERVRRLPTAAWDDSQLPSSPASASTSSPQSQPQSQQVFALTDCRVTTSDAVAVVATAPAGDATGSNFVADMLDMMDARDQDKKDNKKRKLPAATAASSKVLHANRGEQDASDNALAASPTPSGSQKGVAKSKGKKGSKDKLKGAAKSGASKLKLSAGKCGQRKIATEAIDNEIPNDGGDAEGSEREPPLTLGCGKCRGNRKGCGQCRNPTFNGKRWQR